MSEPEEKTNTTLKTFFHAIYILQNIVTIRVD